jgi:outer membrane protein
LFKRLARRERLRSAERPVSSIVELSQAQYQQTDAAITNINAQYQYRLALATLNYEIGATP